MWYEVLNGNVHNGSVSVANTWKNGVATTLSNGVDEAAAYSVVVAGTDVYVAGFQNSASKSVAKTWKNGVATSLTNGSTDAEALCIFIQ